MKTFKLILPIILAVALLCSCSEKENAGEIDPENPDINNPATEGEGEKDSSSFYFGEDSTDSEEHGTSESESESESGSESETNTESETGTETETESESESESGGGAINPPVGGTGISLLSSEIKNGELTLTCSIASNPGISAYDFTFTYDESMLSPGTLTQTASVGRGLFISSLTNAAIAEKPGTIVVHWLSSSAYSEDGSLFTLSLKLLPGAAKAEVNYSVSLSSASGTLAAPDYITVTAE